MTEGTIGTDLVLKDVEKLHATAVLWLMQLRAPWISILPAIPWAKMTMARMCSCAIFGGERYGAGSSREFGGYGCCFI